MKRTKLLLPVLLFFYVLLPGIANASMHHVEQPTDLGVPYSLAYLAQQHKLHHSKPVLNETANASLNITCEGGYYTDWTITLVRDGVESYTFNTHWGDYHFSGIEPGTYTVTLHNQDWANFHFFDANIQYADVNNQGQTIVIYDVNTDNDDIVFENVVVNGEEENSLDIWVGPH